MELVKVGEKTYYIKNPTNIGVYKINDEDVYLIDSGNDKDAGKKILKIIEEQGWKIGEDIHLVHAPERIIPGNMVYELLHNNRTIGADSVEIGGKIVAEINNGKKKQLFWGQLVLEKLLQL